MLLLDCFATHGCLLRQQLYQLLPRLHKINICMGAYLVSESAYSCPRTFISFLPPALCLPVQQHELQPQSQPQSTAGWLCVLSMNTSSKRPLNAREPHAPLNDSSYGFKTTSGGRRLTLHVCVPLQPVSATKSLVCQDASGYSSRFITFLPPAPRRRAPACAPPRT